MADPFAAEPDAHDVCALPLVRRVAALLDQDATRWQQGMPLPHGWEFVLFTPAPRQSDLRADGHHLPEPDLGDGVPLKLMLGGRRFRFVAPAPIGARVTRTGEVANIVRKEGRAGAMTIVTRRYRLTLDDAAGALAVEEEDMVYRAVSAAAPGGSAARSETSQPFLVLAKAGTPLLPAKGSGAPASAGASGSPSNATPPAAAPSDADRDWLPDEALLFRYAAIGNNAHRIHYDLPHAQTAEGFPALVVNGGLTALMLVELFRTHAAREPAAAYTMRRPLFCNRPARLRIAARPDDAFRVWAEDADGRRAAEATIR